MAGFVPAVAQSIAFGIGNKAMNVSDSRLQFEIGRVDISLTSLDLVANKVTYKAVLPETVSGILYEIGIYSTAADAVAGEFGSRLISTFDSASEDWVDGTGVASVYSTAVSRIGGDSLRQAPAASTARTDILNQLSLDLSGFSGNDLFIFAFNAGNAFTASIRFRFMTDLTNYYDITLGAQTTGYKFVEVAKSTAVVTGAPDWERITAVQVTTTATSGGAAQVDLESIRIEDVDTVNPDYILVSRELLATPFVKEAGKVQEVEFALGINV